MAEAQIQPIDIVERIFSNWTALRMAVEHGMGSQAEAYNFCGYIAELLEINDQQMHYTDLSIELENYLDEKFNTTLEDDSEKQVAQDLVKFHLLMIKKDVASLQAEFSRLPSLQPWIQDPTVLKKVESDSESDDEEMDTDDNDNDGDDNKESGKSKPKGGMEVDQDGWTIVKKNR
ncbi:uncharacterized protein LOC111643090 [Copidosoma floridanum]|uniref:uncharacterized protein LOC106644466 n=1 Tax=Copidosoma floridanum TaxID=29053 RepID=UPI0006C977E7|nr:uncharacterized protein LOC106644466 [Copidosoma floridanum]XP_023245987.1 uncharacterized protein LOC111643090 [Copidosoma floridanum]